MFKGKIKRREKTERLIIVYRNYNRPYEDIEREYYKKEYLYAPFHVFIDEYGELYISRPLDSVGSSDYVGYETDILIVLDTPNKHRLSHEQEKALIAMKEIINEDYGDLEIIERDETHERL